MDSYVTVSEAYLNARTLSGIYKIWGSNDFNFHTNK